MRLPLKIQHLTIVPVLSTALVLATACKEEGSQGSKSTIYTYELTGTYSPAAKRDIGGRYEYGTRASKLSSKSGTVKTKITTAGPKKVTFNVNSKVNGKTVKCAIVVFKSGKKLVTINNSARNSTTCTFKP